MKLIKFIKSKIIVNRIYFYSYIIGENTFSGTTSIKCRMSQTPHEDYTHISNYHKKQENVKDGIFAYLAFNRLK